MNLDAIRQRLDDERRYLARDGEVVEALPCLTRVVNGRQRMVAWSALDETNVDEMIACELANHQPADGEFEWKLYRHDRPVDLLSRLKRHGLLAGEPEAVMVYDLHEGPPITGNGDCVVRRITEPAHINQYRRVAKAASNRNQSSICDALAAGLSSGSTQHLGYVASVGDEAVSIGRLYTHPLSAFGGLYGGATLAAYRGRGFYRAVVAARAAEAIKLGARYLLVDALPTSRPILERLGFERLTDTIPCQRSC